MNEAETAWGLPQGCIHLRSEVNRIRELSIEDEDGRKPLLTSCYGTWAVSGLVLRRSGCHEENR